MSCEFDTNFRTSHSNVFYEPDVVENVLKYLDNDNLLMIRPVSKQWNHEVGKLLFHRKYLRSEPLNLEDSSQVQQLHNLLKKGPLINSSILIGTIRINAIPIADSQLQKFLSDYGKDTKSIIIDGPGLINNNITTTLINLLKTFPNVETIKLNVEYSHLQCKTNCNLNFIPGLSKDLNLNKLTTIDFKPSTKYGVHCFSNTRSFNVSLLKEIIRCSDNLDQLILKDIRLADYLEKMSTDCEDLKKFKKLQSLSLCNARFYFDEIPFRRALLKFLLLVSSSLEILQLVDGTWSQIDFSLFPLMPKLETIIIKASLSDPFTSTRMNLSCKSLPKLRTLILVDLKCPLAMMSPFTQTSDFESQFSTESEGTGVNGVIWEEDTNGRGFIFDKVENKGVKKPLNVEVYTSCRGSNTQRWLNSVFQELTKMKVASLVVDLEAFPHEYLDLFKRWSFNCIKDFPCLKHYLIHTINEHNQITIRRFKKRPKP